MHYQKPALTYEQQVSLLKDRGLKIASDEDALHWLERIGYYRLSAYFIPFKVVGQDLYLPDATFQKILDLYQFDARLRLLTMQAIDMIEVSVRAALTYRARSRSGAVWIHEPSIVLSLHAIQWARNTSARIRSQRLHDEASTGNILLQGGLRRPLPQQVHQ